MHPHLTHQVLSIKKLLLSFFENSNPIYWIMLNEAFKLADRGPHKNNPYHNAYHHYAVAKMCARYMTYDFTGRCRRGNSSDITKSEQIAIFLAALLHDYSHGGKPLSLVPDSLNIKSAIIGVDVFISHIRTLTDNDRVTPVSTYHAEEFPEIFDLVKKAIRSTEVAMIDGLLVFKEEESPLIAILRDADVTAVMAEYSSDEVLKYSNIFFNSNLFRWDRAHMVSRGLAREINVPFDLNFQQRNIEFWESVNLLSDAAEVYREKELPWIKKNYTPVD